MSNEQWCAHVQVIAADLAEQAGTVIPVIRLRRDKGMAVRRTRQAPGWTVLVPYKQVDDSRLRGSLAHELQHVRFEDGFRLTSRSGLVLVGLVLLALLWVAAIVAVLTRAFPLSPVGVVATILSTTVLILTAIVVTALMLVRRDDGLTQPVVELRSDLAAADLVGATDATASLRDFLAAEQRHHWWWQGELNITRLRTHPDTQLRIDAIEARDPSVNPLAAAQQWLAQPPTHQ